MLMASMTRVLSHRLAYSVKCIVSAHACTFRVFSVDLHYFLFQASLFPLKEIYFVPQDPVVAGFTFLQHVGDRVVFDASSNSNVTSCIVSSLCKSLHSSALYVNRTRQLQLTSDGVAAVLCDVPLPAPSNVRAALVNSQPGASESEVLITWESGIDEAGVVYYVRIDSLAKSTAKKVSEQSSSTFSSSTLSATRTLSNEFNYEICVLAAPRYVGIVLGSVGGRRSYLYGYWLLTSVGLSWTRCFPRNVPSSFLLFLYPLHYPPLLPPHRPSSCSHACALCVFACNSAGNSTCVYTQLQTPAYTPPALPPPPVFNLANDVTLVARPTVSSGDLLNLDVSSLFGQVCFLLNQLQRLV